MQPFANTLMTLDLTGAQLKAVLEQQWQPAGSTRPFLKLGVSEGFSYVYDPTAAAGSRIGAMYLNGALVTPDQTIHVVTNSFLAAGGDEFTAFTQGTNKADSGRIDLDAFVDYIGANSPLTPDFAQRAVGVVLDAAGRRRRLRGRRVGHADALVAAVQQRRTADRHRRREPRLDGARQQRRPSIRRSSTPPTSRVARP